MTTRPNFFIIGAARAGTSALTTALREHPQAFVTEPKEPHFLAFEGRPARFRGPGDDRTVNRVARTDLASYLELYEGAGEASVRGDAAVSTLYYGEDAIATLERHFAGARLIAILRDPVARAFSNFQYLRSYTREPCADFERALELEDERVAAGWHHIWHYRRLGYYGRQLEPFVRRYGPEHLLILFHDDLTARPQTVLDRVSGFLGIEPLDAAKLARVNVSGEPRNPAVLRASRFFEHHPRIRGAARGLTSYGARSWMRRRALRSGALPAAAATRLREAYVEDLALLRELVPEQPGWSWPEWLRR